MLSISENKMYPAIQVHWVANTVPSSITTHGKSDEAVTLCECFTWIIRLYYHFNHCFLPFLLQAILSDLKKLHNSAKQGHVPNQWQQSLRVQHSFPCLVTILLNLLINYYLYCFFCMRTGSRDHVEHDVTSADHGGSCSGSLLHSSIWIW